MQAEVPLPAEAHECVGGLAQLVVPCLRDGVPEEEGRDRRCWAIDCVSRVTRDIEQELGVDLGDRDAEVGGQGLAGNGGPLAERVVGHAPILPVAPSQRRPT